jgi:Flp pilus assembly protein TadD
MFRQSVPESPAMSDPNPEQLYDAAIKLKSQGDLQACVDQLNQILVSHPEHVRTHMALAVYQQKLGRFDDAITHAKKVTELAPTDAFSFTQLSVIYQRCGKIFEAEDAMARARMIQGTPQHH